VASDAGPVSEALAGNALVGKASAAERRLTRNEAEGEAVRMTTRSVEAGALEVAALEAASAVPDPELPVVTLGDLGIVRGAAVGADGVVEVRLTPTFVGCPATEAIAGDVRAAVEARLARDGAAGVGVRTRMVMAPAWSTDWISEEGRRKLAEHGIAPPHRGARAGAGSTEGMLAEGLPTESSPTGGMPPTQSPPPNRRPAPVFVQISPSPSPHPPTRKSSCGPHCGSADTRELSAFGSTPCQSLRACRACGEPFGAMKSL
jgi:ring-1,2-phenylacetyl-CoA epoxidase subunit PaaD